MGKEIEILKRFEISPKCLYPTEKESSLYPDKINQCYEYYQKTGEQLAEIVVFQYDGYYYIYAGHEQVLAAINFGSNSVEVAEIERTRLSLWGEEKNFIEHIREVGMTAIYDYEAIGGFTFGEYPSCFLNTPEKNGN